MTQDKAKKHNVTPAGRAKLAAVGTRNLTEWQERTGGAAAVSRRMNEEAVKRADELIQCAIDELGGDAKLNARQRHLLESQRTALLVLLLTQSQFRRKGLLLQRSRPDPLLATSVSYANVIRLNLEALGLSEVDPNAPPRGGIADWLAEREKRDAAAAEPTGDDADGTS